MSWVLDVRHGIPKLWARGLKWHARLHKKHLGPSYSSHKILMIDFRSIFIFEAETDYNHALFVIWARWYMMLCATADCTRASLVPVIPLFVPVVTLVCRSIVKIAITVFEKTDIIGGFSNRYSLNFYRSSSEQVHWFKQVYIASLTRSEVHPAVGLVWLTTPSKHMQVIQERVYGFICTLPSILQALHHLVSLHSRAKAVQEGFEDFLGRVPLVLLSGNHAIRGCPFQVVGKRIAFLFFCHVFFLKMRLHYLYPGVYTAVGFIFIASRFFKHTFRVLAALTGPGNLVRKVFKDMFRDSNTGHCVASRENPAWPSTSVVCGSGVSLLIESLGWALILFEWFQFLESTYTPAFVSCGSFGRDWSNAKITPPPWCLLDFSACYSRRLGFMN